MPDLPTRLDLFAIGRDYVVQRATRIDPAQVDVQGSDVNLFVGSSSEIGYAVLLQLAFGINRLLLDGAEGDDLDRYAFDRYGITRKGASGALGTVQFSRLTAIAGGGTVAAGQKLRAVGGSEYITTTVATFATSDLSAPAGIAFVRAIQAGKSTQVGANNIRQIQNAGQLWDSSLLVTNPAVTAGGEDVEDDDTFRERIRGFWLTARRGILAAISFGALTVPGVVSAVAQEVVTSGGSPARLVNLFIADSSGVSSDALATLVLSALSDYRAAGIQVVVSNSIPQIQNVVLRLTFNSGVDTNTLASNIKGAIVAFINNLPVNGTLFIGDLQGILRRYVSDGLINSQGSIVSPAGDVVPGIGQTLRTTATNVTSQ